MNEEQIKRQFSLRIRENYEDFLKDWLSQEPEELVSYAEEISAAKMLAEALPGTASPQNMEYLLRFENPLEVVRDKWMSYNGIDMTDKMEHTLRTIRVNADLLDVYAPSKEHLTVRELLELYPDDSFDIMTPGGFVYLTPEKAREMLSGKSTMGHPGCSGCGIEVSAEELLPQKIQSPSYENGTWHFLSYFEPEMEQQPTAMEQGVTMC